MNKKKLLETLKLVKSGLASKEILEQSTNFIFDNGLIATYNDEIAISHPFDEIDFSCVVPSKELLALLTKSKDEEIEMSLENDFLAIQGKKFKASLMIQSNILLPIQSIKDKKFKKIPSNFNEAARLALFSVSKDISNPALTCLFINNDGITSCDGYRFTNVMLHTSMDSIMLPANSATELVKYNIKEYCIEEQWAHFKLENDCLFSCRILNVEYPNLDKVLADEKRHEIKFSKDMREILDRASSVITDKLNASVTIEVESSKVVVSSKGDFGKFEELSRMKSDKDKFSFQINPFFLSELLMKDVKIELGETKMKFIGDDFYHFVVLQSE